MITDGLVKSTCGLCFHGCGILIRVKNGRVTGIKGDPDHPVNQGTLCIKGAASLEYLYHPDRLKHPLKRIGERGKNRWQQISWDEALNMLAAGLISVRDNHGPESVAFIHGAAKGLQDSYMARLGYVFGTPNVAYQGHVCFTPRTLASLLTCGFKPVCDYEYPPSCIAIWGLNTTDTIHPIHEKILRATDKGTKLIVIDPRETELARKADIWVRPRPGSDLALALGMMNTIVYESLYDSAFVDNRTVGFDKLRAHIQDYPPEKVEELTWVPADTLKKAARVYATSKPACIQWGNAIDHNVNSFQTARAISILRAITGNLGVPGGELCWTSLPLLERRSPELELFDRVPVHVWQKRVGADLKIIPISPYVTPPNVIKAIIQEDPYPIRAAYTQGANPLLSYSNAQETYTAIKKLDFLAVADMFMTPTAALADVVLPVASYLEFDSIAVGEYYPIASVQQKVAQIAECWSDYKILSKLAKRLGLEQFFWDSEEQCLDAILKPGGLTFSEFRKIGVISGVRQYRTYEANGVETPSRKIELYSSQLKEWGFDPLPVYREPPETPYSEPELAEEYPLILGSCKSAAFRHSGGRQIARLRGIHPEPLVNIHPETATKLEIEEGDWVHIETKRGRIKQRANLTTDIDPRVVWVDYAWWFPEKGASDLYSWAKSNVNILTNDQPPFSLEMGSTNLRGLVCKVYKASA